MKINTVYGSKAACKLLTISCIDPGHSGAVGSVNKVLSLDHQCFSYYLIAIQEHYIITSQT